MSKTLDIVMSLKDQVSPTLGKMNSNLQTTSGKLNTMGKSITKLGGLLKTAFVGGTIAKIAYDSLKAADIQAKAEKSVQRALIATGKTATQAGQELNEYKEFASKQQDITAFGDEGTLKVISGLISQGFGKKSIEDIVAMSQDIARSTGDEQENVTKSLSAYIKTGKGATKLAKAYKLNADLLGKGKTESERLAEVWKAFSESEHKGASTEFLKGFEGQLVAVKARLDDFKEPVGDLINTLLGGNKEGLSGAAGGLASIGDTIKAATDDLAGINDKAKELGGGLMGIGAAAAYAHPILSTLFFGALGGKALSALSSLITSARTVATAIQGVGSICAVVAGSVAGLTAGVVALVGVFDALIYKMSSYLQSSAQVRNEMNAQDNPFLAGGPVPGGVTDLSGSIGGTGPKYAYKLPKYATGTNYFKGGFAQVNEHGGEIMNLPNGTQIIPHDVSTKMGSGASITNNITIQGNVIGNQDFINEVGSAISGQVQLALSNM